MTDEEIDALVSGNSLDAMIHTLVMGKRAIFVNGIPIGKYHDGTVAMSRDRYIDPDDTTQYIHATDGYAGMIPRYSTSIEDAWAIAGRLHLHVGSSGERWYASSVHDLNDEDSIISIAGTAPLAICKSALKIIARDTA